MLSGSVHQSNVLTGKHKFLQWPFQPNLPFTPQKHVLNRYNSLEEVKSLIFIMAKYFNIFYLSIATSKWAYRFPILLVHKMKNGVIKHRKKIYIGKTIH